MCFLRQNLATNLALQLNLLKKSYLQHEGRYTHIFQIEPIIVRRHAMEGLIIRSEIIL